jgi:hypothetical protein
MLNELTSLRARVRSSYNNQIRHSIDVGFITPNIRLVNIDGLAAVKTDVRMVDSGTDAGGLYISSRDPERNIVLTVEFDPDHSSPENSTVTGLRQKLSKIFAPQNRVELLFYHEYFNEVMFIVGTVESNDPTLFSEETQTTISILCEYPYFQSPYGEDPAFFNLANTLSPQMVPYDQDVNVGFVYSFDVTADTTVSLGITGITTGTDLIVGGQHLAGDRIEISTGYGNRYVRRTRSSATQTLLGRFVGNLQDTKLFSNDDNWFQIITPGFTANHRIAWRRERGSV